MNFLHGADYNYEQWIDRQDILDQDLVYMKEVKANVMSVGIFSWSMLESEEGNYNFKWLDELFDRLHNNGQKIILATPSGSKPAWLSEKYPEVCRMNMDGTRQKHGYRHNHCRTSLVYREKCAEMNMMLAKRYKKHPALLMWHVSNEYNGEACYCPLCIRAFRMWLKAKYKKIENLNKAWWTTFWSHRFNNWDEIFPNDESIHGLIIDWQRFTSQNTIDFFLNEIAPLKKYTPDIPVTTNFMFPDVGLDYHDFAKYVDVISWDSYPDWHADESEIDVAVRTAFMHDLHRSYKRKHFLLMESSPSTLNWKPTSRQKMKGMHKLSSMQAVAHGADSVQYFQWRQSRGAAEKFHSAVVSHIGTNNTRIFNDVKEVGELLEILSNKHNLFGVVDKSEVAIVYDFENTWALYQAGMPQNEKKKYQTECIKHYKSFWKKGIQCDIVSGLLENIQDYKLVILPMLYMFREGVTERIRSYVEAGGIVVATYCTGLVNENDLCYLGGTPGELTDVFGIKVEQNGIIGTNENASFVFNNKEYNAYDYLDLIQNHGAQIISKFNNNFDLEDLSIVTKNNFGSGSAYYLAVRTDINFLDAFYEDVCRDLKLNTVVKDKIPEGVSVQKRGSTIFVMNFTKQNQSVKIKNTLINIEAFGVVIKDENEC